MHRGVIEFFHIAIATGLLNNLDVLKSSTRLIAYLPDAN